MPLRLPQPLPHSSAALLEFDPLRHLLRGYAASPLGQARVQALVPSADATWIASQQQLTAEIREFLRAGSNFDFSGLFDPQALLEKARIQGVALEIAELRDLLKLIDRAGAWRQVPGVVHGASSSGQTGFIEPMETIEQNNELVRLLEEEHEEIRRILLEMTRRIAERSGEIELAAEILGEIELQFAKARFAEELNCVQPDTRVAREFSPAQNSPNHSRVAQEPALSDRRESNGPPAVLLLHQARHPLLDRNLRAHRRA